MIVLAEKIGLLHTEVLVPAAGGEAGLGRVGCLHEPMTLQEFSEKIKTVLKLDNIIAGDAGRRVSKVAVCGGAGAEFIDEALAAGSRYLCDWRCEISYCTERSIQRLEYN